jgi:hypothetical protein
MTKQQAALDALPESLLETLWTKIQAIAYHAEMDTLKGKRRGHWISPIANEIIELLEQQRKALTQAQAVDAVYCVSCGKEIHPSLKAYGSRCSIQCEGPKQSTLQSGAGLWQPIETAPKDGSSVLVFDYYQTDWKKHEDGRYVQTGPDGYGLVVARFDKDHGWHVSASVTNGNYIRLFNPTRWMPTAAIEAAMKSGER